MLSATAAAASAFVTWCSPCRRSATSAAAPSCSRRNRPWPGVERHVGGAHVGVGAAAEGQHARPGAGGHGRDAVVVGVEDGQTLRGQRLDQLALGLRGGLQRAELARVGGPHDELDPDVGARDPAQLRDVAEAAGPHLHDEGARAGVGAQHGERGADLVVEAAAGGDDRPVEHVPEDGGQQVLRRRLALRAGDPHDERALPLPAQALQDARREAPQRGDAVLDEDQAAPAGSSRARSARTTVAPAAAAAAA